MAIVSLLIVEEIKMENVQEFFERPNQVLQMVNFFTYMGKNMSCMDGVLIRQAVNSAFNRSGDSTTSVLFATVHCSNLLFNQEPCDRQRRYHDTSDSNLLI